MNKGLIQTLTFSQCGNIKNLLSPKYVYNISGNQLDSSFFSQKHCFHEIFVKKVWKKISLISTLWCSCVVTGAEINYVT